MTEPPPEQPGSAEPPEQPGPAEQDPESQQPTTEFDQQPPDSDSGYGYPGGPAEPPQKKSNAGVITTIVVGAVLVLAGAGTGVYFLTKSDSPKNDAISTSQSNSAGPTPTTSAAGPSGTGTPPTTSDNTASIELPPPPAPPPTTTAGGGGGGGGDADDAQIVQVAEKYAKAVTSKDEASAKSVTCDNESGLLYASAEKVEVVAKPDKYGDDTASINVKISLGGGSEPIDNFPLFMDKKNNAWCVSS